MDTDMNYSPEISAKAQKIIDERRTKANYQLEMRRREVYRNAPEAEEVERQAASAVTELTRLIISGQGDFQKSFERIKQNNLEAQSYVREILSSHGYPEDYLEIKYTCPLCEDKGYTEDGKRCHCFEELASKLSIEELNRSANMPDCDFEHFDIEYYPKTLDSNGVVPYDKMKDVLLYCRKYAANFSCASESLLMLGKTGVGKTHLSIAIAKTVTANGFICAYGSVLNFLYEIEKEHFGRGEQGKDTMSALLDADLLVMDDLGTENYTTFYESVLYNIINTRINTGKPTIVSTNLSTKELYDKYNERIISRIFGVYTLLRFYGKDIRQEKRLRGDVSG